MRPEPSSRVVVLAPNWLGDCVMALPAVAAVRAHYPAATLAVAARAPLAPLFELADGVDEIVRFELARPFRPWLTARRDAAALASGRFDLAILLPNSFRAAWIARRAGIAERWGYAADGRRAMLTRMVPKVRGVHQAEYYLRLVEDLVGQASRPSEPPRTCEAGGGAEGVPSDAGTSVTLHSPILTLPDALRERARNLLEAHGRTSREPLVGMAPGAAFGTAKQWPPERFGRLAAALAGEGLRTVLIGTAADARACREAARQAPTAIDVCGQTTLSELAAVLAECERFVTNDSGAMHLAAAVGVPVTAIFGSTNERETSPLPLAGREAPAHAIVADALWCRPCMLRDCPLDHVCMTAIDVPRVLAAAKTTQGRA